MTGLGRQPRLKDHPGLVNPTGARRAWYAPLLLLLLLLGLLTWYACDRDDPAAPAASGTAPGLPDSTLRGPRGPTCLRLIVGVDESGSMRDFASARDSAFTQLFPWATRVLRPDDEVAVIDFAFEASVRMPPTRVGTTPAAPVARPVRDGVDTVIGPVFDHIARFPPTDCDSALVLLSDAQIADLPATADAGRDALRTTGARGIHDIILLVPGEAIDVPLQWQHAFPAAQPRRFEGLDEDATASAIGQTIARLTGQSFVAR